MSGPEFTLVEDNVLLTANVEPVLVCFLTEQFQGFGFERTPYQGGLAPHLIAIPCVAITKCNLDEASFIEGALGLIGRFEVEGKAYHLAKLPHRDG